MAFFGKVRNILAQSGTAKNLSSQLSASNPSVFQAIRCMSSKLFIGGLSYTTDDQSLREAFGNYGQVIDAKIILDRETGRSRGFGFITYNSSEEASSAIQALNGQDLHGRNIRVDFANERTGGGGFNSGGFGGGGSNYGGGSSGYGGGSSGYGGGSYGGGSYGGASGGGNYANRNNGGGGGGSDNYAPIGGYGGADQFGTTGSSGMGGVARGFNQAAPMDENFRDDDDAPDNFAKSA